MISSDTTVGRLQVGDTAELSSALQRMRCRRIRALALASAVLTGLTSAQGAQPLDLFVATNGNDHWSGRLPKPKADASDGPLATVAAARDAVRTARLRAPSDLGPIHVLVRGGTYRLEAPLMFGPEDSGTAESPVSYEAYVGEKPILCGGRKLSGFRQRGSLWELEIPDVKAGKWYFHQLFVNGRRQQRARSPNTGYYRTAAYLPGPPVPNAKPFARDKFAFGPGDIKAWDRLSDVNLILMHSWETSIHPLRSVDTVSNVVELVAPLKEWWGLGYWEDHQRYYLENALEFLDEPGEWYLNRETGVLSYWPQPGETPGEADVVAPLLSELLRLGGDPAHHRTVQHLRFRGLAFQHADWALDPKGDSSTQAAVEVPAALVADGAENCSFEGCEIAHVGTYGLWLRSGCKRCRVVQTRLFDLGAGGIRVGEAGMAGSDELETTETVVDNNHIFDGGHVFAAGVGIWLAQSSSNRISHNDIHDLLYSGLSIGWNWDDARNRTHDNLIEFNHVHNLVHGVLSDAGLIYCSGVSPGSVIRNNVFHDIWPYSNPPFGWGIYLDATCGGYRVESNLVYNTRSGGLMYNNGGHEHVIENNIFALSVDYALWPYHEKRPNTFRRNIVYLTEGELLVPYGERSLKERVAAHESPGDWEDNIYWRAAGAGGLKFYGRTFAHWQELGLDPHSRVVDPQFLNPGAADFRLRPESPALAAAFHPIDITGVGLYGPEAWAREARHADCPVVPLPPTAKSN